MDLQHVLPVGGVSSPFSSNGDSILTLSCDSACLASAMGILTDSKNNSIPRRAGDVSPRSSSYTRQRSRLKVSCDSGDSVSFHKACTKLPVCEIHGHDMDCWNGLTKQAVCRLCNHAGKIESAFAAELARMREKAPLLSASVSEFDAKLVEIRDRNLVLRRESLALQRAVHDEMQRWIERIRSEEETEARILLERSRKLDSSKTQLLNTLAMVKEAESFSSQNSMIHFLQRNMEDFPSLWNDNLLWTHLDCAGLETLRQEWLMRKETSSTCPPEVRVSDQLPAALRQRLFGTLAREGMGPSSLMSLSVTELDKVLDESGAFSQTEVNQILVHAEITRLLPHSQ